MIAYYVEHSNQYGIKVDNEYFIFPNFQEAKEYIDQHPDYQYFVFDKGRNASVFPAIYEVYNLALDCSETLDLQIWQGHTYQKISYDIKDELDALEDISGYRIEYIKTKQQLGKILGIEKVGTLTNAQLVRKGLNIPKAMIKEPFEYNCPIEVDESDPLIEHFLTLGDKSENYTCELAHCECVFSRGGVHSIKNHISFSSFPIITNSFSTPSILYYDITSYYPSLIKYFKYIDNDTFNSIYDEHIKHKTPATKLFLNTTSGVLEEANSNIATNMRITGQILIYLALKEIEKECLSFELLNLNTDGFICKIDEKEQEKLDLILKSAKISQISKIKCQKITSIFIKDINNYVAFFNDGTKKVVGSLKQGVDNRGRFSINNNAIIIKNAVINLMQYGQPIDEFIYNCDDDNQFQLIASAGNSFSECRLNGATYPRVVRVFPTTDNSKGTIYKTNNGIDLAKIPYMPEQCDIDAKNIDKAFYIEQASKIANEYGVYNFKANNEKEENKPMAEKTTLNVYQKLNKARTRLLNEEGIEKSGFNTYQGFHYFTLQDIIPAIQKIFDEIGLIGITSIGKEEATLTIVNTDDPNETILFTSPMIAIRQDKANRTTNNDMQDLGGVETYQRRYLYLMALDIIEPDTIDNQDNSIKDTDRIVKNSISKANYTPNASKREQATLNLTDTEQQADELQVQGLERVIKKARALNDEKTNKTIDKLYAETNHLKNITRERCEKAILWYSNKIEELNNGVEE